MKYLFSLLIVILPLYMSAQSDISGVINHYASVTAIEYCDNQLTVSSGTNFNIGDELLILQMRGATINTNNNASFGDITDSGQSGLFEKGTIADITGNLITLENNLTNTYEISGQVQIVSFPNYDNALVSDTLTATAWDGSTGGVLAFSVNGELELQEVIDVTAKGFRGGMANITASNNCSFLTNANNYAYALNNWRGAQKGEGIAPFLTDEETGRGAQANGGGGGNDHNSGGGGGANRTAGGKGGTNNEPSNFGCDGNFPGEGGKVLPDLSERLFLGGGGGAGHENNDAGTDGGNGGGLIIIQVGSIKSNGHAFIANGANAEESRGDGAGGGGGGGTVFIDAMMLTDALQVLAVGGDGGNCDNINFNRCMGPGGGGSGGRIFIDAGLGALLDLSEGVAGLSINSSASNCPESTNGAQNGISGISESVFAIPEGTETNSPPSIIDQPVQVTLCTGQEVIVSVEIEGFDLTYQWQMDQGSGFADLSENAPFSGTQTPILTINDPAANLDGAVLQLIISSSCFPDIVSTGIPMNIGDGPVADFDFSVNGLTVQFNNNSQNADAFSWDFGDTQTSIGADPSHTYSQEGTYTVVLSSTNDCGTNSFSLVVDLQGAPVAAFTAQPVSGCTPLTVQFTNISSNGPTNFTWSFPGGDPATSNQENPVITYDLSGNYDVQLIVSNGTDSDTSVLQDLITVANNPVADFMFMINGLSVQFTNNSQNADAFSWDFGDTQTSMEADPSHTYDQDGTYTVVLSSSNDCGSDDITLEVTVSTAPTAGFTAQPTSGCAPLSVQFTNTSSVNATSFAWLFPGGDPAFSTQENPVVTYNTAGSFDVRLTASNAAGLDSAILEELIVVTEDPTANFNYQVNDLTVTFENLSAEATGFQWSFGDTNSSMEVNPVHTYAMPGTYIVNLQASNECGNDFLELTIQIGASPAADFSANLPGGCVPHTIQFMNQSSGTYDQINWAFPGGNPASSTDENPVITYETIGSYEVSLTVSGSLGSNTSTQTDFVDILPIPIPEFSYIVDELSVQFTNNSSLSTFYSWNFGDDNTSTDTDPVHTFGTPGAYEVTLNAQNAYCGRATSEIILVMSTGTEEINPLGTLQVYPNPTQGMIFIKPAPSIKAIEYQLVDTQGRLIQRGSVPDDYRINLRPYPAGLYFLELASEGYVKRVKVIRQD